MSCGCVGEKVVQDDVDAELDGDLAVDFVQKGDELVLVVTGADVGDDGAPSHVECGEEVQGPLRS